MALVLEDKTKVLRKGFFEVQNCLGVGRDEEDYHQALKLWLSDHGVPFASKCPHSLFLYGEEALRLFPDFVAWDEITVELKAVPRNLARTEFVQLFDYLKLRGDRVGLLVNMGLDRVHVERIVYEPPSVDIHEDWRYWSGKVDAASRELGLRVRQALRNIYAEHSTGYGDEVLRKLTTFALVKKGLSVVQSPVATSYYGEIALRESPLDCLLIEDRIVLTFTALFDNNDFNLNRGRTYLKALGLRWGIAANFGKTQAQLTGLYRG